MSARSGSLVVRLVALAIVQLVVTLAVGDWIIRLASSPPQGPDAVASLVGDLVAPSITDRAALARTLERLKQRDGTSISIYEKGSATPIASNVDPPLAPSSHDHGPPPRHADFERDGKVYTVLASPPGHGRRGLPPPMINFLAGLAIVSLWAIFVGRWVVAPLGTLTRAVRAAGSGDLGMRTHLVRRDEIGEVGRAFDEMAGRLQELLRAEKVLLANVSHELRTPLARIRVALDLAAEGDAELARASLADIAIDLSELETIIDDILTATKFDIADRTPGFALRLENVVPVVIAKDAVARFSTRHPKRKLTVTLDETLPAIAADPALLRRALDNLLENAHKYTPDVDAPIAVTLERSGSQAAFEVRDRGVGIPASDLPHLFTPFFRGDKSRSRGTGGVGLGLTLAKRIVEAHRGTIAATSNESGTSFRIEIPRA